MHGRCLFMSGVSLLVLVAGAHIAFAQAPEPFASTPGAYAASALQPAGIARTPAPAPAPALTAPPAAPSPPPAPSFLTTGPGKPTPVVGPGITFFMFVWFTPKEAPWADPVAFAQAVEAQAPQPEEQAGPATEQLGIEPIQPETGSSTPEAGETALEEPERLTGAAEAPAELSAEESPRSAGEPYTPVVAAR